MISFKSAYEAVVAGLALKLEGRMIDMIFLFQKAVGINEDLGALACKDVLNKDMAAEGVDP